MEEYLGIASTSLPPYAPALSLLLTTGVDFFRILSACQARDV